MNRSPRIGTVLLALTLPLAACAGSTAAPQASQPAARTFPMTVQTCGRKVTFDERPERALVMDGMTTTLVVAGGRLPHTTTPGRSTACTQTSTATTSSC